MVTLISVAIGLLVIAVLSVLAVLEARAEEALWSECRRSESIRQTQQQISVGKSHIR
jgi:hypothetical protein